MVDQTGLNGTFDCTIEFVGDHTGPGATNPDAAPPAPLGMPLLTALREQLGRKLAATKAPVRMLIVDHVERPSEN